MHPVFPRRESDIRLVNITVKIYLLLIPIRDMVWNHSNALDSHLHTHLHADSDQSELVCHHSYTATRLIHVHSHIDVKIEKKRLRWSSGDDCRRSVHHSPLHSFARPLLAAALPLRFVPMNGSSFPDLGSAWHLSS